MLWYWVYLLEGVGVFGLNVLWNFELGEEEGVVRERKRNNF